MSRAGKGTSTPSIPAGGPPVPLAALARGPIAVITTAVVIVQALLLGRYGFHRDELYFMVAGDHPDWGYVDQPPLTPMIARVSTTLFGDDPPGLRVVAVAACAATVWMTAVIARELGGGRAGQALAAGCAAASGMVLAVGHMLSTATLDILAWLVVSWLVLRVLRTGDGRWWPAVGVAVGVATANKYLVAYLVLALLAGVLAVGPRAVLRSRGLAVGIGCAVALCVPGLIWQAAHDWPQFTVAGGIGADDGAENRIMFAPLQIAYLSPVFVPIWVAGAVRLWRSRRVRWARAVVPAYATLCVLVLASGGKSYYALPLLLVLVAAGCEPTVRWVAAAGRGRRVLLGAGMALAASTSSVIALPILPPDKVDVVIGVNPEQGEQVGWPEVADAAAVAWSAIAPEQRSGAVLFAGNYGEAGALARYGPARGLPRPYSGHMSFADWGPPPDSATGPVVFVHEAGPDERSRRFGECRVVARVDNAADVDNEERGALVELCSGPVEPWSRLWPSLRHYY